MSDVPLPADPSEPDGHFAWCSAQCRSAPAGRGAHRSAPRLVRTAGGEVLSGWLVQLADGVPRVVSAVDAPGGGAAVSVSPAAARQFGRLLCGLADAAEGRDRNGGRF